MTEIISTTILLILIMDPLGNLPIFMTILKNLEEHRRRIVVIREMIIALIVMLLFLFFGEKILTILNLKTATVSISGGIILFLIAIKMIFPSDDKNNEENSNKEPFLVPLAIPLIAGPSLLATLILLSHQYLHHIIYLVGSLLIAWFFTIVILLLSSIFLKLFGSKGMNALERLMGLILILLATQMFLDGIREWFEN